MKYLNRQAKNWTELNLKPAADWQKERLIRSEIPFKDNLTYGQASRLIGARNKEVYKNTISHYHRVNKTYILNSPVYTSTVKSRIK